MFYFCDYVDYCRLPTRTELTTDNCEQTCMISPLMASTCSTVHRRTGLMPCKNFQVNILQFPCNCIKVVTMRLGVKCCQVHFKGSCFYILKQLQFSYICVVIIMNISVEIICQQLDNTWQYFTTTFKVQVTVHYNFDLTFK